LKAVGKVYAPQDAMEIELSLVHQLPNPKRLNPAWIGSKVAVPIAFRIHPATSSQKFLPK
jgi:hypothetical protein